jgi:hypothetical protein
MTLLLPTGKRVGPRASACRLKLPAGWLLGAGLCVFGLLAVASLVQESATYDEAVHLSAGLSYWEERDFRLNPEHPPLIKLLAAAPLLVRPAAMRTDDPTWQRGNEWEFGYRFLYAWNDAERVLQLGRLPIVVLGAALAATVFLWARTHWGFPCAVLAFLLCVFDPNVLAHSHLVTTDIGFTLALLVTVIALERFLRRPAPGRALALGLASGAALASKFSSVVLFPLALVLVVAVGVHRRRGGRARPEDPVARAGGRPPPLPMLMALVAIGALGVLWASYGMRPDAAGFPWSAVLEGPGLAGRIVPLVRRSHLVPEACLYGFVVFLNSTAMKPAFLLGETSLTGWPSYFPIAFLVKTPLPLLLLLVLAVLSWRRHRGDTTAEIFLLLPPAVYVLMACARHFNIGHRHILPIYPFLFILAGRCATLAWGRPALPLGQRDRAALRIVVAALLLWHAGGTLRVHPHHLAFFNELVGGPAGGYRVLADSNLDWGQDLKNLGRWVERHHVPPVKLSYFGGGDPDYYRIPHELLPSVIAGAPRRAWGSVRPGDWVAISATNLAGLYLEPAARALVLQLRRRRPVDAVGYSILIYRADFAWDPPPPPPSSGE